MSERARRRSPLAVQLMLLLAEEPTHAYQMQQLIKARRKDQIVNIAQRNSVYQTLDRLLRAELIEVQETVRESGRPERTVYRLTEAGHEALDEWLTTMLSTPAREFPEFPVALAALPHLTPQRVIELLSQRVRALQDRIDRAVDDADSAEQIGLPRLFNLEDEYQRALSEAELSWVQQLIEDLRSERLVWDEEWLRAVSQKMGSQSS